MIWIGAIAGLNSSTNPVGVPGDVDVTAPLTLTAPPSVIFTAAPLLSEKVVVVGLKLAEAQFVKRLATFTEPSPVAKS
jgi:hypothetical protein